MTIDQLLTRLSTYQGLVIIYFVLIPVVALGISFLHSVYGGRKPPWNAIYALLLYLVALPTAAVIVATGYLLLFDLTSFGDLPMVVTYLPLGSFVLTSLLVKRAVDFYYLPAILNPYGLLLLLLSCMSAGFYIYHTEVYLLFGRLWLTVGLVSLAPFLVARLILGAIAGKRE
ncbi:MAG: hypothetical protein ACOC45_06620 [Alkalispirochaetaceae bacterium]